MFYTAFLVLTLILAVPAWAEPNKSKMTSSKTTFIEVKSIEHSLHLAHEASVEELFSQFSKRPPNKRGIFAQELFDDDRYVYWGKPIFKGTLFLEKRGVEQLYKTSKSTLTRELPIYKKIWKHTLRGAADKAIRDYRKSHQNLENISYPTCQASLRKGDTADYRIVITAKIYVKERKEQQGSNRQPGVPKQAQYTIILSGKDLSLLEIKPI